jgi:hypothetical protein
VRLARTPNYESTPDEPQQKWWKFTNKTKSGDILYLEDATNFTQSQVDYYKGGDVWAIEDVVVMCTFWRQKIDNYEPASKRITVSSQNFGGVNCRYFENTPYLQSPGNTIMMHLQGGSFFASRAIRIQTQSLSGFRSKINRYQ